MKSEDKREKQVRVLKNVALISGLFALMLCFLIIINFIQWKKSDPLNSKALTVLVEQSKADPGNEQLKEGIRELDRLARRAYFTGTWQVRTGGILLFISILIIIMCYQVIDLIRKKIPQKPETTRSDIFFNKGKKRNSIMISGGVIVMFALVLVFFTENGKEEVVSLENPQLIPVSDTITDQKNDTTTQTSIADSSSATSEVYATLADLKANYPFFRGPMSTGVAFQKNIPTEWDGKSGKNILWKIKIPLPGYNSPILWNGKIFLSGASEQKREVYCINAGNGKIEWTTSIGDIPGSPVQAPKVNKETGFAAPTMATDGIRVYAIFANGDLVAIDLSGKQVWAKNLGSPKNHYGHSSSLITWHDLLLVQYDQSGNAFAAAFSGKTGDQIWKTQRNVKVSWASPVLVNTGKRTELILAAEPFLAGYDPANGKELWRIDCVGGEVGPSPAYANGIVFSVNEYSKLAAVRIGDNPSQLWEDTEYLSDVPSPVATEKYLFLTTSYGALVCYDALTGEKYWMEETWSSMYASPVLADGKIYQLDQKGKMHIFSAKNVFESTGNPEIGEGSFCTPAFADGRIYIRGNNHLFCIGK